MEDEKEIIKNSMALKLPLTDSAQALPSWPSAICANKHFIANVTIVSQD